MGQLPLQFAAVSQGAAQTSAAPATSAAAATLDSQGMSYPPRTVTPQLEICFKYNPTTHSIYFLSRTFLQYLPGQFGRHFMQYAVAVVIMSYKTLWKYENGYFSSP